jgi:hypothetical protein
MDMAMDDQPDTSFKVQIEEGDYRGGLFELERVTIFRVVEVNSEETRLELRGEMNASLDSNTGGWGEPVFYGVADVILSDDGHHVLVTFQDGHTEIMPIP